MDCNDGIGNDSLGSNSEIEYDDDMLSPCLDQGSGQGRCQGLVVAPESQEHNSDPDNADADGDSTIICATSELTELHESESEAIDLEHMELFESNAVDVEIPTGCGPGTYACISCCSLTELLDTVEVVNEDLADVDTGWKFPGWKFWVKSPRVKIQGENSQGENSGWKIRGENSQGEK